MSLEKLIFNFSEAFIKFAGVSIIKSSCLKVLLGFHYKMVAMFLGRSFLKIAKRIEIPAELGLPWQPIGIFFLKNHKKIKHWPDFKIILLK